MWKKITLQDDDAFDLAVDACLAILTSLLVTLLIHAAIDAVLK